MTTKENRLLAASASEEHAMKINTRYSRTGRTLVSVALLALTVGLSIIPANAANADSLYIGDYGDNTVKHFDAKTGAYLGPFVTSESGGLQTPNGIIFAEGKLFVSAQFAGTDLNGEILEYSNTTGQFLRPLVPCNTPHRQTCDPSAPQGLISGLGHTLYVADFYDPSGNVVPHGSVAQFDAMTGSFVAFLDFNGFTGDKFGEYHPRGVVFGPDGLLYVSVTGNAFDPSSPTFNPVAGFILRFNPHTGRLFDVFASNQDGGCAKDLHRPSGLTFGHDGKLYVTSFRRNGSSDPTDTDKILIFDSNKTCVDAIVLDEVGGANNRADSVLFGPEGRLFVPIFPTGEVRRYNVQTKTYDIFVPSGGPLQHPFYLTFGNTDPRTLAYNPD